MDDKSIQALTALATKLGTTAEYLWGVLIRQAPISAVLDLAVVAMLSVGLIQLVRVLSRKTKESYEDWHDIAWSVVAVLGLVAIFIAMVVIPLAITALLNPEYWALRQILK